jgi:hypothetical protein
VIVNNSFNIGDIVGFKSDVEQCGVVVEIKNNILILESLAIEGFEGDYIGGSDSTSIQANDVWIVSKNQIRYGFC